MTTIIIHSLKRLKRKNYLIGIQFFVGFFSLILAMSFIDEVYEMNHQIRILIPDNSIQVTCDDEEIVPNNKEEAIKIKKIQNSIEKVRNNYHADVYMFDTLEFEDKNTMNEKSIKGIMPHYDMMKMISFSLVEGTAEPLYKYNGEKTIPILVSKEMANIYPMGTKVYLHEITSENEMDTDKVFVVVGVLSRQMSYFTGRSSFMIDTIRRGTDMIFFMPEITRSMNLISNEMNVVFIPEGRMNGKKLQKKIEKIYTSNQLTPSLCPISYQIKQNYEGKKMMLAVTAFFSVVLLLLASIGCMGTVLASVLNRKEEFGIYVALGFTQKQLGRLIMGELISVCMCSFVLAGCAFLFMESKLNFIYAGILSWRVACISLCAFFCCIMMSLLIPLKKLKSMSIIDMVEGR